LRDPSTSQLDVGAALATINGVLGEALSPQDGLCRLLDLLRDLSGASRILTVLVADGTPGVFAETLPDETIIYAPVERSGVCPDLQVPGGDPGRVWMLPGEVWLPMRHRGMAVGTLRLSVTVADDSLVAVGETVATQVAACMVAILHTESLTSGHVDRFRALIEHASDIVMIVDGGGWSILYASPATERVLGFSAAELVGQPVDFLGHPDEIDDLWARHAEMMSSPDKPVPLACRARHKDGHWLFVEGTGTNLNHDPAIAGLVVNLRDITDRHRHQEALLEQERLFRTIAEHVPAAIVLSRTADGRVLYANETTAAVFGRPIEAIIGQPAMELYADPDDRARLLRLMKRDGTVHNEEILASRPDGRQIWTLLSSRAVTYGGEAAAMGIVVDVTEQRQVRDAIASLNTELERRVEARTSELVRALDELRVESDERLRAERSRQESEDKYRLLFDNDQHAIVLFNADTLQVLDVNGAWLNLYGYTADEAKGLTMNDVSITRSGPVVTYDEWSTDGTLEDALRWHRKKEGLIFPVEISAGLVTWHEQRVVCAIMRDISERLRAEAEARQRTDQIIRNQRVLLKLAASPRSEFTARLKDILAEDAQALGVERVSYWRLRENGTAVTCEALYLLSDRKVHTPDLVLHAKDHPAYFRALREAHFVVSDDAQADLITGEFAETYLKPMGITSVLDAPVWVGGQVVGVVCHEHVGPNRCWSPAEMDFATSIAAMISIAMEVESRRRAEEALILSEQRFRALVQNSSDIITLMDEEGHILYDSPAIERVLGYRMAERLLRRIADYVHPDDIVEIERLFEPVEEDTTGSASCVFRARHAAGHWVYLEMIGTNLLDNPAIRGIVGNARDITERKVAEEEMQRALDKARELSEMKTRFVSMTSHEFRTPLTTIMSNAEMLERYGQKWAEEKRLLAFQRINESVKQMVLLLDDVLMIGKVEAGKLEYNPRPVDLVHFCTELIETIRSGRQNDRLISFTHRDIPPTLPLDDTLLRHVLLNVLTNAVKYSPAGSDVTLDLLVAQDSVVIRVADKGIGIPESDLEHLFEPFYRATNVGTISGTGLGLTIVKRCVERHGGTLQVASAPGDGTTFTISIPVS
jgi:PAS domain S-box-containing protein